MNVYPDDWHENRLRFIEWHAALIRDPIQRLGYLRRAAGLSVPPPSVVARRRWRLRAAVLVCALFALPAPPSSDASLPVPAGRHPAPRPPARMPDAPEVWLVETDGDVEMYSNGLRIDSAFAVAHSPRFYRVIRRGRGSGVVWESKSAPAGIVFHTTESHLVLFEPGQNGALQAASRGLLEYVRRHRLYHFAIDRFGRVHRVVQESDAANHAGRSLWADDQYIYLNLNESFLAIAFEAKHVAGTGPPTVTAAQIHAGRALTEMLRCRYGIRAENCVTHAQVSVNPSNRRIAYHTDWASHFPFNHLGLPDNYEQPLPSVSLFGFGFDPPLDDPRAPGLWKGLRTAEAQIRHEASAREMAPGRYRRSLQQHYQDVLKALEPQSAEKERDP